MDIIGLIPSFGGLLWTISAFIVALSIIVAVHEYGHYIVGRWTGIHAEVFSIGFGPVLASRYDKRGTKWQIAALPFGGYVKFLGDASAVSDKASDDFEAMDSETKRHTMHGAPLWARAATVFAGPAFNFVLSFLIFAVVLFFRGVASEPLTVEELRPAPEEYALLPGDEIVAIAGETTPALDEFSDFLDTLPVAPSLDYDIRRDGTVMTVPGPFPYPAHAVSVSLDSAAEEAGLMDGDVIRAVDGASVFAFSQLREIVGTSDGQPLTLDIWRDGESLEVTLTPRRMDLPLDDGGFETRWLIGISGGLFFEPRSETPSLGEAAAYGVEQTIFIIRSSLSGLYHMAAGAISTCNLSGPIGIAETSGAAASQGWVTFIWFIAVLSTAVGLLNLFPIPVLDGGHLVFHAWEALTGRPPSDRALNAMMTVGLGLMAMLMVFALTNDIFCP
ncbi:MAG: RIP metalloprotease RseP [Paracoccaceae bacterium]|nr:RIP metalloprotease RseP [Paracoccaceae bacterium]